MCLPVHTKEHNNVLTLYAPLPALSAILYCVRYIQLSHFKQYQIRISMCINKGHLRLQWESQF